MTLGSTLLFGGEPHVREARASSRNARVSDEAAAAARLVELAIRESKALGGGTGEAPAPPETQA